MNVASHHVKRHTIVSRHYKSLNSMQVCGRAKLKAIPATTHSPSLKLQRNSKVKQKIKPTNVGFFFEHDAIRSPKRTLYTANIPYIQHDLLTYGICVLVLTINESNPMKEMFIKLMLNNGYGRVESEYIWAELNTPFCDPMSNVPSLAYDVYDYVKSVNDDLIGQEIEERILGINA